LAQINPVLVNFEQKFGGEFFSIAGFVDDTTVAEKVVNHAPQGQVMLNDLSTWVKERKLAFNPKKCGYMVIDFSKDKSVSDNWVFNIDGVTIPRLTSVKLLGVVITPDLKWDSQIESMIEKASSKMFILQTLKRHEFQREELIKAYKCYIRPILEYANVVWGPAICSNLCKNVERVQKRAMSIIVGFRITESEYDEWCVKLTLERLADRRNSLLQKFGLQTINSERFRGMLPPFSTDRKRVTRKSKKVLLQPFPAKTKKRYAISTIPTITNVINNLFDNNIICYENNIVFKK
jgi:hypothetical protein